MCVLDLLKGELLLSRILVLLTNPRIFCYAHPNKMETKQMISSKALFIYQVYVVYQDLFLRVGFLYNSRFNAPKITLGWWSTCLTFQITIFRNHFKVHVIWQSNLSSDLTRLKTWLNSRCDIEPTTSIDIGDLDVNDISKTTGGQVEKAGTNRKLKVTISDLDSPPMPRADFIVWLWTLLDSWCLQWHRYQFPCT